MSGKHSEDLQLGNCMSLIMGPAGRPAVHSCHAVRTHVERVHLCVWLGWSHSYDACENE